MADKPRHDIKDFKNRQTSPFGIVVTGKKKTTKKGKK